MLNAQPDPENTPAMATCATRAILPTLHAVVAGISFGVGVGLVFTNTCE